MTALRCARIAVTVVLATGAVTACSSGRPGTVVTVTVQPAARSTTASAAARRPTAVTAMKRLPGTCRSLLPAAAVKHAVPTALSGKIDFVVGMPDKTISRIGYVNCRYGVTDAVTPAVEIGVSLYRTADRAAARIRATAADYGTHGASARTVLIDRKPATLLTGGNGVGYDAPTIVLSSGQRTIAVSVSRAIPAALRARSLTTLAAMALRRTAR